MLSMQPTPETKDRMVLLERDVLELFHNACIEPDSLRVHELFAIGIDVIENDPANIAASYSKSGDIQLYAEFKNADLSLCHQINLETGKSFTYLTKLQSSNTQIGKVYDITPMLLEDAIATIKSALSGVQFIPLDPWAEHKHKPNCNLNQDWSEAEQAMADTPDEFRDESYYIALEEIEAKKSKCTCGLKEALEIQRRSENFNTL